MSSDTNTETRLVLTALFLIFLTLKLCHVIVWSWWWIFAPIWIPLTIGIIGIILVKLTD